MTFLNNKSNLLPFSPVLLTLLFLFTPPFTCQPCLTTQYLYITPSTCLTCPLACSTCTSSMNCTMCETGTTKVVTTLTERCYCPVGKFFDMFTLGCGTCSAVIANCVSCQSGLTTTTCTSCSSGYYLLTPTTCPTCPTRCLTCTSPTTCQSCIPGYDIVNGDCVHSASFTTCNSLIPNCLLCTTSPSSCSQCEIGYRTGSNTCTACSVGCLTCNPGNGKCTKCLEGYTDDGADGCVACSVAHSDAQCLECSQTRCTACSAGYVLNTATLVCQAYVTATCSVNSIDVGGYCLPCADAFGANCDTCNIYKCLTCVTGFIVNPASGICIAEPFCGDGDWVVGVEGCDDGGVDDNDGCDASCNVEVDYYCLVADRLASGESLCKYTRQFTITLNYIHKDIYSNLATFDFTIEPSSFKQWTLSQLQKFLTPIQIVDSVTGTSTTIPYNTLLMFGYQRTNNVNQFKLQITYGPPSIESLYLRFTPTPSLATFPSLTSNPTQSTIHILIDSKQNGVNLYHYSSDVYDFQWIVTVLAVVVGYTALVFLFLGWVAPVGKLIVVEALAVIQISFFSMLGTEKMPPTFVGFKHLLVASGYNLPNLVSETDPLTEQTVYRLLNLSQYAISNYNLSYIILFLLPLLFGLIGLLLHRATKTDTLQIDYQNSGGFMQSTRKNSKDDDKRQKFVRKLRQAILKRITFQSSFYGLMATSYCALVSCLHSLKSELGITTIIVSGVFFTSLLTFTILYMKSTTQQLFFISSFGFTLRKENSLILTGFGDFRSVYQQISKNQFYYSYAVEKVYVVFIIERVAVAVLVVFVAGGGFRMISGIVGAMYLVLGGCLVVAHCRYMRNKIGEQRKTLGSYLYGNYVLRQLINFITIIVIQVVIFGVQLIAQSASSLEQPLSTNMLVVKVAPILILSLLTINLLFNMFLWIWQHHRSQIFTKIKLVFYVLTTVNSEQQLKSTKTKQQNNEILFNLTRLAELQEDHPKQTNNDTTNKKPSTTNNKQTPDNKQTTRKLLQEEDYITQNMQSYVKNSKTYEMKNSPFLGVREKREKSRVVGLQATVGREEGVVVPKQWGGEGKVGEGEAGEGVKRKLLN